MNEYLNTLNNTEINHILLKLKDEHEQNKKDVYELLNKVEEYDIKINEKLDKIVEIEKDFLFISDFLVKNKNV